MYEFGWDILRDKKIFLLNVNSEPIVPMAAIRYSDPIRPFPTYVLRAAKRRTCIKIA